MGMELRFLVDANVGKLARWLRRLGYDAAFHQSQEDDSSLVRAALNEGRIILTRDGHIASRGLARSGRLRVIHIQADDIASQMRQVLAALPLEAGARPFTRCLDCNVELLSLEKWDALGRVPPYVFETQERFSSCPQCRRVFWQGTHWAHMKQALAQVTEPSP